jgi:hypothetical protein
VIKRSNFLCFVLSFVIIREREAARASSFIPRLHYQLETTAAISSTGLGWHEPAMMGHKSATLWG